VLKKRKEIYAREVDELKVKKERIIQGKKGLYVFQKVGGESQWLTVKQGRTK